MTASAQSYRLVENIRYTQKTDAYEESQKERKAAQYHITHNKGYVASHSTHGENAHQHNPSPFEADVLMLGVGVGGYRRAEDIRRQRDGCCLICSGFSGKGRT